MALDIEQVCGQAGTVIELATVEEYEYVVGEDGGPSIDTNGVVIPTGRVNISMLEREGGRNGVPFVVGGAIGQTAFNGALPELKSIAVVAWRQQQQPIIIGFLPPGFDGVTAKRGTIPALKPGEQLIQASSEDITNEGRAEQFVGARIKLDAYGREVHELAGYRLTVGYLLSDEYGPDVQTMLDPVTNQSIYLQEVLPNGTGRRVDDDGNTVWTYGKSKIERVGENVDSKIDGSVVSEARDGHVFQDRKSNRFGTDADGNFSIDLATGGVVIGSLGGQKFQSGGPVTRQCVKGVTETIGAGLDHRVMGVRLESAGAYTLMVPGIANPTTGTIIPLSGIYVVTSAGPMALTSLLTMSLTATTVMTLIAPQVLIGPAPEFLTKFSGMSAIVSAIASVLNGLVPGSGAAITALLPTAATTVLKGT